MNPESTKADAINAQQSDRFGDLDTRLQNFIQAHAAGEVRMATLQASLSRLAADSQNASAAVAKAIGRVDRGIAQQKADFAETARHEKLRGSLKFPSLNARRNQIANPHSSTFNWIFDPPDADGDGDDDDNVAFNLRVNQIAARFCAWLSTPEQPLFWISGKPGSGKSTLIKMISSDPRTTEQLMTSGSSIILSHFIWSAGHPMEAKIKGLLCSLLHQLIDAVPDLTSHIIHTYPHACSKEAESDWAYDEIREILLSALASVPGPVCIFVDGLDEIDPSDGQADLLRLLADLRTLPHIKMCVASRPEPTLQRSLRDFPGFRMQDLTFRDIKTFAADRLDKMFACLGAPLFSYQKSLVKEVSIRAEGVFLWVALALKSLERGLNNEDDTNDLERRLQTLPSDLGALYREMWSRLGEDEQIYRKDAAKYLGLVFHCLSWKRPGLGLALHSTTTLLRISLASKPELANRILCGNLEPIQDYKKLSDWCAMTARHMETRCAGLLEVSSNPYEPWRDVQFVHRSVKEFLENDDEGRKLLADGGSAESAFVNVYTAALAAGSVSVYLDTALLQAVYYSMMEIFEPLVVAVDEGIVSERTSLGLLRKCHALFQSVTSSSPWESLHHTPEWCEELKRVDTAGIVAGHGCLLFIQKLLEWDRPLLETRQRPSAQYMAYLLVCLYGRFTDYKFEEKMQTFDWIFQHEIELNTLCAPRGKWSYFSRIPRLGRLYLEPVTPLQLATKTMLLNNVWDPLGIVKRILHASTDRSTPMILSLIIAPPDNKDASFCSFFPLQTTAYITQLTVALETNIGFVLKLAMDLLVANTEAARLDAELLSTALSYSSSSLWKIERGAIFGDDHGRKCHEITGSQGESLICFLKQKSRLVMRDGDLRGRRCPGIYSVVEGMMEEGKPVPVDDLLRDWAERDIIWREDDERVRVPRQFS